jgi:upstream activation factor subunit UAF30
MDDDDATSDESEEEQEDQDQDEDEDVQRKKRRKTNSGGGTGLAANTEISPELAAFLGKGNQMARTEIVKELWNYIRQHNLQNPDNKREILLDHAMKNVFGVDSFTMFTMNKYIGAHVYPFKPVDLTTNSMPTKRKQPKEKKPRKPGTQAPYQLSPELARVTGKQILPRPQVTKALWAYIRKHNLQVRANSFLFTIETHKSLKTIHACTESGRQA